MKIIIWREHQGTTQNGILQRASRWNADKFFPLLQQQVEKQEKKKLPKGRAMKRLKYTRRFVNVTLTGGKRKVRQKSPFEFYKSATKGKSSPSFGKKCRELFSGMDYSARVMKKISYRG